MFYLHFHQSNCKETCKFTCKWRNFLDPISFSRAPEMIFYTKQDIWPSPQDWPKIKAHFSNIFAGTIYSLFLEITFKTTPSEKPLLM